MTKCGSWLFGSFGLAALCLSLVGLLGQTTPVVTVAGTVPPAIGQPGVTVILDSTNKVVTVTYAALNASSVSSNLFTVSYNPHLLEGISAGALTLSAGGVTTQLIHNAPSDPLRYQIGNVTTVLATCSTVTPLPTGSTACPQLPF